MSKELDDIKGKVMAQIREGRVRMKPRVYFLLGSALTLVGLVCSTVAAVFFFGLIRFGLRMQAGAGGKGKFLALLEIFPWWAPVLGVSGLIAGVLLLRRYDFSYKKKFWLVTVIFILSLILAGFIIDVIGLNEIALRHYPMRGILRGF